MSVCLRLFSCQPEVDACGGVHPPVLVEVRHLHPLSLAVDEVVVHQGPGLVELLRIVEALDGEYLGPAAAAGIHGGGGAFGVRRDEELHEPVVEAFLVPEESALLRTVEPEELRVRIRDDAGQIGVLQHGAEEVGAGDVGPGQVIVAHGRAL